MDPLESTSRILEAGHRGRASTTEVARSVQEILQKYNELQDIIAILGMDELSDEDKKSRFARAQACSASSRSPSTWRKSFPACRAATCPAEGDASVAFANIVDGEMDDYPEAAFFNVGGIDEVREKAEKLKEE